MLNNKLVLANLTSCVFRTRRDE